MLTDLSIKKFLNETASNSPAPGGGSVSALAASLGCALTSMVGRLTIGKKKYSDVQVEIENVLQKSDNLLTQLTSLIDEDTDAFNNVMTAMGLPKDSEEEKLKRLKTIQEATKRATLVPLKLMELCSEAVLLVKVIAEKGNQNSLSDAGVAALLLDAGCNGAALNVKINLNSIQDAEFINNAKSKMELYLETCGIQSQDILKLIRSKL
jgi:formiminotetrahydrofolate cyclodeaminase